MINISVCITTFNRKDYLERAIISCQFQLLENDEVVIQDNCSMDGTQAMVKRYTEVDSRIKYFINPTNIGPVLNFGEAIRNASNNHVYFLTDDDFLIVDALKKVRLFFQNNNARVFKTAFFHYNEKSKTGQFICELKNDVGKTKATIKEATAIFNASHILTGLCFEKGLFTQESLEANKDNWYQSMLLVGMAGLDVGYLSEPTNVHTWENETYWGIEPSRQDELNRGEAEIIKFLFTNNYITYEHFAEIVIEHVKIYPDQNNNIIVNLLEQNDKVKARHALRSLKIRYQIKKGVNKTIKIIKKLGQPGG
jgi:glycosyltransferase involved in cell wall biosynthesis